MAIFHQKANAALPLKTGAGGLDLLLKLSKNHLLLMPHYLIIEFEDGTEIIASNRRSYLMRLKRLFAGPNMKIIFLIFLINLFTLLSSCAGPFMICKTEWTVPEVKEWYSESKKNEPYAWDGILYQGTDDKYHHFIARVLSMDNWAIIKIKKKDLNIDDEQPYLNHSSSPLGYYFVDPSNNFIKIREYNTNVK
jgi:hypothetical protein